MLPVYVPDALGLIVMLIGRSYIKLYSREYYTVGKSLVFSVRIGAVDHPTSVLESVLFSMAIIVLSGPDHSPRPTKNDLRRCFTYLWLSPCCLLSPSSEVQIIHWFFFPCVDRADGWGWSDFLFVFYFSETLLFVEGKCGLWTSYHKAV